MNTTPLYVWFIAFEHGFGVKVDGKDAAGADWFCTLSMREDRGTQICHRIRYYSADNASPFSGKDLKYWSTLESTDTGEASVQSGLAACRQIFDRFSSLPGVTLKEEVPVKEGDMFSALEGKSWCHFQRLPEAADA